MKLGGTWPGYPQGEVDGQVGGPTAACTYYTQFESPEVTDYRGETEAQVCGREGTGLGHRDFIWKKVRSEPSFTCCGLKFSGERVHFPWMPSLLFALYFGLLLVHPRDLGPSLWSHQGPALCPPGSVLHCRNPVTLPVLLASGLSLSCHRGR